METGLSWPRIDASGGNFLTRSVTNKSSSNIVHFGFSQSVG